MRLVLMAALFLAAGTAVAEEALTSAIEAPDRDPRRSPREEVFRMVDAYIAENLQAKLGLSDEELARALPVVRRLHAERRRLAERKVRAFQQMKRAVRTGAITDARALDLLQEMKAAEAAEAAAVRAGQDAVNLVLSPVQQVKYRILEGEIEHRLREVMARVRAQRMDGPGRDDDAAKEPPPPR
jgi:membrane-bound lytic murein transglycosylase